MKAILINPELQQLETIEISSRDDIVNIIGYDTLESDDLGNGDRLFFDEECFLRGTKGRFQIDKLIPVSGTAVVIGSNESGKHLSDVKLDTDALQQRLKYL